MKKSTVLAAVVLALVPAALALAGGAGGIAFSSQYFHPSVSSADLGISSITGFGYGVGPGGGRVGGFGTAFFSSTADAAGGLGGMLVGHEWNAGPIVIAFTLWGGVGGGGWGAQGGMLAGGGAQAELGWWVVPWMQVCAFVGYQAITSVIPGPFGQALLRTPMVGMRIAWGGQ